MKTTTVLILGLTILWLQTSQVLAQNDRLPLAHEMQLLKLDSIVTYDFSKYEYIYNLDGQLLLEKFYVATDSVNMIFALMSSIEHKYENYKKITSTHSSQINGSLKVFDRHTYKYENGKLSVDKHEYLNNNKDWICVKKYEHIYGKNESLSEINTYTNTNDNFKLVEQATYYYDLQWNKILNIIKKTLKQDNSWLENTKTDYVYESGNMIMQTDFVWNDTTKKWSPTDRKEYLYDSSNSQSVGYKESVFSNNDFVVTNEKNFSLDSSCPVTKLILPCASNLPFKVQTENNIGTQKISQYYYSNFTDTYIPGLRPPKMLIILPNPAKDKLIIQSAESIEKVDIFDFSGKLAASYLSSFDQLDISGLAKGCYFVKVKNSIQTKTFKLIKE